MPSTHTLSNAHVVQPPRRRWLNAAIIGSAAMLLLGSTLTFFSVQYAERLADERAQTRFSTLSSLLVAEIQDRFNTPVYGLKGARSIYATAPTVNHDMFRAYVETRDLAKEFPGIRGFGFIEPVPRNKLPAFLAAAKAEQPAFQLKTSGSAEMLYVIRHIEPIAKNGPALGLDVGAEPIRHEAVERAIASGEPALTRKITLKQDNLKRAGFLILLPVYESGIALNTPADRRTHLRGLVYAPIVAEELLQGVLNIANGELDMDLFDNPQPSRDSLILDPDRHLARANAKVDESHYKGRRRHHLTPFSVGGRQLAVWLSTTPQFEERQSSTLSQTIAVAGGALTLLISLVIWLLGTGKRRAELMANKMNRDLDLLAKVAKQTSNAVLITNKERRITWVNEGFTRVSGYSPEEALNKSPGSLLQCEKTDPATIAAIRQCLNAGQAFQGEILNRSKSGTDYWLQLNIQPLHDKQGALTGFMAVESDVTEIKTAQAVTAEALKDSNLLHQLLREHFVVSMSDTAGRITEVNDALCRISGYERSALIGQKHSLLNSGQHERSFWVAFWRQIANGSAWHGEICNRSKSGVLYWVETVVVPIPDGNGKPQRYLSVSFETSSTHRAMADLDYERESLANVIRGTGCGTWEWNADTNDVVLNERWFEILGHHKPDFEPLSFQTWISLVEPDDLAASQQLLAAHLRGESSEYQAEFRMRHADGHWHWVLGRGQLVTHTPDGKPEWVAGIHLDIHQRKQTEAALADQQMRMAAILAGTNVGTWEWNVQTGETRFNDRWFDIVGHVRADFEPTSIDTWMKLGHPDDVQRSTEALADHFEGRAAFYDCEVRMQHRDGHWVWVHDRGRVATWTADGKPEWMFGTHMDITDRKAAEQSIQESHAFIERAGQIAGIGGWELDIASNELIWSEQTFRIHDLPIGKAPSVAEAINYYAPEARPVIEEIVANAIATGHPWDVELPFITATGRHIWVRATGQPRYIDGQFAKLSGAFQDITERRLAAEKLERANSLFNSVINAAPNLSIIAIETNGSIQLFSRGAEQMLGYTASEVIGKMTPASFHVPEEVMARGAELSTEFGRPVQGMDIFTLKPSLKINEKREWTYVRKDGSTLPVVLATTAIWGDHDEVLGYMGVAQDIREQKDFEAGLIEAKDMAEQASLAKSQFLANMSHEIRTPMNAILGLLQLMRHTPLNSTQRDYTDKTEGATRALLSILNDILDFSKVEAGKMTLDPQPFRVDKLFRDLGVIVSASLGDKPLEILFDIDPDLPASVIGDENRIKQVLINLVSNAIKFTHDGEVVVKASKLAASDQSIIIRFEIRDTGIGMTTEQQSRLFASFTQAEASTTRRYGGTGLGLVISLRLVELMGSTISLESELGHGSTFQFDLTLVPVSDVTTSAANTPMRLLVVDDNPNALAVMDHIAKSLGWHATLVDSGQAAIDMVLAEITDQSPFDAAIVDWSMPNKDGWETSEALRQIVRREQMPIIMITAHSQEMLDQRSNADRTLIQGFLTKPVTASTLVDAVMDAREPQRKANEAGQTSTHAGEPRLSQVRILLVEDNLTNQLVAKGLLTREGAVVTVADNGEIAVATLAVAAKDFDIVLMDVQMPVMDGYAATREIRGRLAIHDLPIIAMTANALPSDRAACLDAGMNDHVGKPFEIGHLVQTIRHYCSNDHATIPLATLQVPQQASVADPAEAPPDSRHCPCRSQHGR